MMNFLLKICFKGQHSADFSGLNLAGGSGLKETYSGKSIVAFVTGESSSKLIQCRTIKVI